MDLNYIKVLAMSDDDKITFDTTKVTYGPGATVGGIQSTSYDYAFDLGSSTDTITIDANTIYTGSGSGATTTFDTSTLTDYTFDTIESNLIDPDVVERMCKEYPALEVTYRNFKAVYDLVKQDYAGKKEAGELDDDIVF